MLTDPGSCHTGRHCPEFATGPPAEAGRPGPRRIGLTIKRHEYQELVDYCAAGPGGAAAALPEGARLTSTGRCSARRRTTLAAAAVYLRPGTLGEGPGHGQDSSAPSCACQRTGQRRSLPSPGPDQTARHPTTRPNNPYLGGWGQLSERWAVTSRYSQTIIGVVQRKGEPAQREVTPRWLGGGF